LFVDFRLHERDDGKNESLEELRKNALVQIRVIIDSLRKKSARFAHVSFSSDELRSSSVSSEELETS